MPRALVSTSAQLAHAELSTPIGTLRLVANASALLELHLPGSTPQRPSVAEAASGHPVLSLAAAQLGAYFRGELRDFTLPLAGEGTAFQRQVWAALKKIPYGETRSYGEIARSICRPSAVRAVGAANGRNPLAIIVPCHRVIGADGSLTGFAGGMPLKRWLLAHEAKSVGFRLSA